MLHAHAMNPSRVIGATATMRCSHRQSPLELRSRRQSAPLEALWFGIGYSFAILMAVTVLILSVIAWRATETADGA